LGTPISQLLDDSLDGDESLPLAELDELLAEDAADDDRLSDPLDGGSDPPDDGSGPLELDDGSLLGELELDKLLELLLDDASGQSVQGICVSFTVTLPAGYHNAYGTLGWSKGSPYTLVSTIPSNAAQSFPVSGSLAASTPRPCTG